RVARPSWRRWVDARGRAGYPQAATFADIRAQSRALPAAFDTNKRRTQKNSPARSRRIHVKTLTVGLPAVPVVRRAVAVCVRRVNRRRTIHDRRRCVIGSILRPIISPVIRDLVIRSVGGLIESVYTDRN